MIEGHFRTQIERLQSNFGKQAYNAERALLIWKEVQDLPNDWMSRTVDYFIGNHRQAPLVPEFKESILNYRAWQTGQRVKSTPVDLPHELASEKCDYCFTKGYFCAWRDSTKSIYVFKCHCEYGAAEKRNYPLFQECHKEDYKRVGPDQMIKFKEDARTKTITHENTFGVFDESSS